MTSPDPAIQHVRLCIEAGLLPQFLKLIAPGFKLKIKTGQSIRELLCGQLGFSGDYVDNRIQTIFLDGKAVDDADAARVNEGSRLALSAAMPGLVGATFRKGGRCASFRSSISHAKTKTAGVQGEGKITLKLFNMVAREMGPEFLQSGVIIDGSAFHSFVLENAKDLKAGCYSIRVNDTKISFADLKELKNTLQQAAGNLPGKDSYLIDSLANPAASCGECARYCRFKWTGREVFLQVKQEK